MNCARRVVFLLATLALFVACSEEATKPVDEGPNGGTTTYGFRLYQYGTEFYGIWMFSATEWMGVGGDGQIVLFKDGGVYAINPGVTNYLNDIWASGPKDIFVAGDKYQSGPGVILHYDGSTWSEMTHPANGNVTGVFGLTATNVYAVTSDSLVMHYDGSSWTTVRHCPTGGLSDVWCQSLTNVIAVGENGGIERWDGASWSNDSPLTNVDFASVWGAAYNQIYVCGGEQIWLYDGTWNLDQQSASWQLNEIHGSGPNDVWAVGADRNVVHWDGSSWTEVDAGNDAGNDFRAVWGWSGTNAVMLGDNGGVYQYDGSVWNEINYSTQGGWQDMYGLSADAIYAVASKDLSHWDGVEWSEETANTGYNLSVWASAVDAVWTCGWPGSGTPRYVYFYDGTSWSPEYSINGRMPWGVWGADASHIFVAWEGGIMSWYDGSMWTQQQVTALPTVLRDVWGSSATDVFAVGAEGTVVRLQGTGWSVMNSGVAGIDLSAVWGTSSNDVVAVGEAGTIIRFDGSAWNTESSGTLVVLSGVWGDAPDNYWVVGMSGTVLHYDGTQWKSIASGLTSEFSLDAVWGSGGNDVWVGGESGHLMHWEKR